MASVQLAKCLAPTEPGLGIPFFVYSFLLIIYNTTQTKVSTFWYFLIKNTNFYVVVVTLIILNCTFITLLVHITANILLVEQASTQCQPDFFPTDPKIKPTPP